MNAGRSLLVMMVVSCGALSGCVTSLGTFPEMKVRQGAGFKMIRPAARREACRFALLGSEPSGIGALLDDIVNEFRVIDEEIDTLQGARVEVWGWNLLLVRRDCVGVTADLGRAIPVVSVPMDHSRHHE